MFSNIKKTTAVGVFAILVMSLWYIVQLPPRYVAVADTCIEKEEIDCMLSLLQDTYINDGVEESFNVFYYLFNNSKEFVDVGCHRNAHRIGDIAYYNDYLKHKDITMMEFSEKSTACGYGFFHGFMEHLIQDNPDPVFVKKTCEYLISTLSGQMSGINLVCYHGAGHGFMLSQVDTMSKGTWGDAISYARPAMEKCEVVLPLETEEVSECRQGVFNVVLDWMESGNFGLVYEGKESFFICRELEMNQREDCYAELSQKMSTLSDFNLFRAVEIATAEAPYGGDKILMNHAAAGMTYSTTTIINFMRDCLVIPDDLQRTCIRGVVGGLMEHGPATVQFPEAVALCSFDWFDTESQQVCFERLFTKMVRFFPKEKQKSLCTTSGNMFKQQCLKEGLIL